MLPRYPQAKFALPSFRRPKITVIRLPPAEGSEKGQGHLVRLLLPGRGICPPRRHLARRVKSPKSHFGVDAQITELGSQQDDMISYSGPPGDPIGVLKMPAESRVLPARGWKPGLGGGAVAQAVKRAAGGQRRAARRTADRRTDTDGGVRGVSTQSSVPHPAAPWRNRIYFIPSVGGFQEPFAGRRRVPLSDFDPGVDQSLVGSPAVPTAPSNYWRPTSATSSARSAVRQRPPDAWLTVSTRRRPSGPDHDDITDDNIVREVRAGRRCPTGSSTSAIPTRSWAVGELAIAVSSCCAMRAANPRPSCRSSRPSGGAPTGPAGNQALWPWSSCGPRFSWSAVTTRPRSCRQRYATGHWKTRWGIFEGRPRACPPPSSPPVRAPSVPIPRSLRRPSTRR